MILIITCYDRNLTVHMTWFGHLILLLTALITVHLCLHIILVLFQFIVSFIWLQDICTCTFPFILHTHWVTFWWSWICTSRYWIFYFIDQVWMSSYASQGPGVSFYLILVFLLLFYSGYILIFSIYWTPWFFYSFIHLWSCVNIYISYCGDINLS